MKNKFTYLGVYIEDADLIKKIVLLMKLDNHKQTIADLFHDMIVNYAKTTDFKNEIESELHKSMERC